VQSPVDGVTEQKRTYASEDKRAREYGHLVQSSDSADNELENPDHTVRHCRAPDPGRRERRLI